MKFLAIERPASGASAEKMRSLLVAEAEHVWGLVVEGTVREVYFTDQHDAVLVLECGNEQEAHDVLSTLPLVRGNQIQFEVLALRPYTVFSRLFRELMEEDRSDERSV